MKISRLTASKVHGYLPIEVSFFDDLTFLTGLNGSGKTTALRLLMALLAPKLEELGSISFETAAVTVHDGQEEVVVASSKTSEGIDLSVTGLSDVLRISSADFELYADVRRREEARSPILEKFQQHPVFQRVKAISTPMFLGLDRRFYAPGAVGEDLSETRRREYLSRRFWSEEQNLRGPIGNTLAALVEVNFLVVSKTQEVRAAQEQLDDRLREQFFAKAFEYKPSDVGRKPTRLPSQTEIESYRRQLEKIEKAADGVKIPFPQIQSALTGFFEKMTAVVESLDRSKKTHRPSRKPPKKSTDKAVAELVTDKNFIEWIINKPQADRILEHLGLLEEYVEKRTDLRSPIHRFLTLVNSFLSQTRKTVSVVNSGQLTISIEGFSDSLPISALSSGERQLLVMLAHLSLNPDLVGSGVFIVDEPELSLHLDWQERFVEAIRAANPNVQVILATHSPAIILDRTDSCRTLSEAHGA